ncbi:MAG: penicillin-binding protein activator [Bacteriovoracaceae bacterium]|nr:penicillin-binding protein activator [Bacteriovoracaceae bacterium]
MRFLLLVLILISSCSRTPLKPSKPEIRPAIQLKIDAARDALAKGQTKIAIARLGEMHDDSLEPLEKSMKYNLKGVVLFSESEWEKALANFEVAKKYVPSDSTLESQVWLNIASVRYKQSLFAELNSALENIEPKLLPDHEVKKFAQLKLAWAVKYQRHFEIVETSLLLLRSAKTLTEVQDSIFKERMSLSFKELSDREKVKLIDEHGEEKWLAMAYLGQLEAESRYFKGDTGGARDVINWLSNRFNTEPQVMSFVKDFEQRLDSSTRINMNGIGIILPLTGDKGSFGQKALMGLDASIKDSNLGRDLEIHTKDSYDSPAVGAQAVRDLIQQHKVPLIIGGLFPDCARAEYLEAKKWGVLYISLAPVNLSRDEKNHLLIEVQGSIESQVAALVTDQMLSRFGKRVGVIYPQGDSGKAYADEFWRMALTRGMKISGVAAYPKGTLDFRETIQHFLGLQFPRERSEELEIYKDTYAAERSSIRRIQNLPPAVDFDWLFIASYPHEALSLVPTFGYYDAKNLNIFGGPSWASRSLLNEQKNLGKLYFVGEDPGDLNQVVFKKFQETYGKAPTLLEMLGYDGGLIAGQLLKDASISQRSSFDDQMKKLGKLLGMSTEWTLTEGLWIKKMQPLVMRSGEIHKIFEGELQ